MMNLFLLNRPLHNYPESLFFLGGGVLWCGWKAKWIGRNLLRNCFLKHFIGEKIEGKWRGRRKRGKQLLDEEDVINFKEEALDRTVWRTRFEGGYGPLVWQAVW